MTKINFETGYYYLQSRYYDAEICRFINADVPEIANGILTKIEKNLRYKDKNALYIFNVYVIHTARTFGYNERMVVEAYTNGIRLLCNI